MVRSTTPGLFLSAGAGADRMLQSAQNFGLGAIPTMQGGLVGACRTTAWIIKAVSSWWRALDGFMGTDP